MTAGALIAAELEVAFGIAARAQQRAGRASPPAPAPPPPCRKPRALPVRDARGGLLSAGRASLCATLRRSGASKAALAAALGCPKTTLIEVTNGRRLPSLRLAVALERQLGIRCEWWLEGPRAGGGR